jgi:hypothetical protein
MKCNLFRYSYLIDVLCTDIHHSFADVWFLNSHVLLFATYSSELSAYFFFADDRVLITHEDEFQIEVSNE